jgi:hypothetical protein
VFDPFAIEDGEFMGSLNKNDVLLLLRVLHDYDDYTDKSISSNSMKGLISKLKDSLELKNHPTCAACDEDYSRSMRGSANDVVDEHKIDEHKISVDFRALRALPKLRATDWNDEDVLLFFRSDKNELVARMSGGDISIPFNEITRGANSLFIFDHLELRWKEFPVKKFPKEWTKLLKCNKDYFLPKSEKRFNEYEDEDNRLKKMRETEVSIKQLELLPALHDNFGVTIFVRDGKMHSDYTDPFKFDEITRGAHTVSFRDTKYFEGFEFDINKFPKEWTALLKVNTTYEVIK